KKIAPLPVVDHVRGKGLMIGIVCHGDVSVIIEQLIDNGLLVLSAGEGVIRLLPPLTVSKKEIDEAIILLERVLSGATSTVSIGKKLLLYLWWITYEVKG